MLNQKIAKILLEKNAVMLRPDEPFTYASGIKSPIYCDNRLLLSHPQARKKIVKGFIKLIEENGLSFDVVAGTATAGISWAAWIAAYYEKPMVYIRGKEKGHGKENKIEGCIGPQEKVLIVEDLVTTGGSSLEAVNAVKSISDNVVGCVAIFSYGMPKATKGFEVAGVALHTLTNLDALLDVAIEMGKIQEEQKDMVLNWRKDPQNWLSTR
ncbi:MAG: orotate phosphoribosyltransferase [bacterium]|nr:orotate phosphoribosyltransferase [bacterium]MBU1917864.1 orotate phosphoribosyltransferase [bacterium]